MRRALIILAAAAVGAAAAWWFLPAWQTAQALEMIVADDPDTRTAGWRRLLDADETAMTRPDPALLRRIDERLAHHPADPTLIDAHDALRGVEAFDWEQLSQEVVLNAAAALARTREESRARQTLELLNQCPLDAPLPDVGEALAPLFDAADESIRLEAIDVACRWAGEERIDALAELFLDHPSTKLRRRGWLAMAWAQEWPPLDPPALSRTDAAPIDVAEAILYAASRQGVDVTDPALDLRQGEMNGLPIAYLLRPIDTPDARRAIDDLAEGGDVLAQRVRQMRSDPREIPVLRRAALDPEESPGLRRLAAWRLDGLDVPSVLKILAADPADDRGSVYAAAMLAERLLPDDRAADLAREWIASFDDDFKRAGALLSALLGANADLLREAYEAEDMPEVRTAQRNALIALSVDVGREAPIEFAWRTLRVGGSLDPDVVLCLLAAGHREALQFVTSQPDLERPTESVQWRTWMVDRFVPAWRDRVGRPVGGSARALRLHFGALRMLRLLTERRLVFKVGQRVYETPAVNASG